MKKDMEFLKSASLEELINYSLEWMRTNHYSPTTIRVRGFVLSKFLFWCRENGIDEIRSVSPEILEEYRAYLKDYRKANGELLTARTRILCLIALRVFFKLMTRLRITPFNPACELILPRSEFHLPGNMLTALQVEKILSIPDVGTPGGLRDRAIMETLYSTGMRRGELANLLLCDVDRNGGTVMIRQGKGRKDRVVPIGERALLWLGKYLADARPKLTGKIDPGTLFLNKKNGGPLSASKLTDLVGNYVRDARIGRRGSCHLFRHTAAGLMLQNGADLRYVQEFLGHDNPETTKIYTRVNIKRLREVHARTHPAAGEYREEKSAVTEKTYRNRAVLVRRPFTSGRREREGDGRTRTGALHSLLDDHLKQMYHLDFKPATIHNRRRYVLPFVEWCRKNSVTKPIQITTEVLEGYQKHLFDHRKKNGEPTAIKTQYTALTNIRQFTGWLKKRGLILYDPAQGIELPRRGRRLPAGILTEEEAERVLSQPDVKTAYGLRDRSILETLYATGIRRQEVVGLTVNDIAFENRTLFIRSGKGGRDRVVPLGKRTLFWIERYLEEVRPELIGPDDPGVLFLSSHGGAFHPMTVTELVGRYLRAAGIEKKGACHVFRHTAATLMLENGADIRAIQEYLGHVELRTTQIYTRVSIGKLREVHARTHPAKFHSVDERRIISAESETGA